MESVRRQGRAMCLRYSPTMRPLLKSLLLWLLVLALPVQALAAAGMRHCAALHERTPVVAEVPMAAHDHAGAEHHHPQVVGQEAPLQDMSDASAASGEVRSSCSACATCCFALALPVAGVRAASQVPDAFAPASPAGPVAPFLTGGLERPPRSTR